MAKTFFGKLLKGVVENLPVIGGALGSLWSSGQDRKGVREQIAAQERINQMQLDFQQKMWEQTNAYNTPKAQMQRFIDAGLNPHLIYGRGDSGSAGMLSVPDLEVPNYGGEHRALADIPRNILGYTQTAINNVRQKAMVANIEQQTLNQAIEGTIKATKAASDKLSYRKQQEVFDTTVETAKQNLARINQEIRLRERKDTREERVVNTTIKKLNAEIENLVKKGRILSEEEIIKKIDRQLYEDYKLRPSDPYYLRIFNDVLDAVKTTWEWIPKRESKYPLKY